MFSTRFYFLHLVSCQLGICPSPLLGDWSAHLSGTQGGEEWSAVRWLTDLVPEKGVQKFDVLRQLMRHLVEMPPASKTPSKYDMVWDLLYKSRETGGAGASPRYDPVYDLLTNAALAVHPFLPSVLQWVPMLSVSMVQLVYKY